MSKATEILRRDQGWENNLRPCLSRVFDVFGALQAQHLEQDWTDLSPYEMPRRNLALAYAGPIKV